MNKQNKFFMVYLLESVNLKCWLIGWLPTLDLKLKQKAMSKKRESIFIGATIYPYDFPKEIHTVSYVDKYGFTTDKCYVLVPWNELSFWRIKKAI